MSTLSKIFILSTLVLSAFSLTTPHAATRNLHQHHALVARKAVPEPLPAVGPYADLTVVKPKKLRRRSDTSRCAVKPSNSTSSVSSSPVPTSSLPPAVGVAAGPSSSPAPPTSTQAAPTSTKATPPPSSTKAPAPSTSTQAPAPSSSQSSSSGSSLSFLNGPQTGQITFYADGLGACGITNSPSDKIAAVSELLFDVFPGYNRVNPNTNPVCGKSVTITYQGKSTTVKIVDRCTACAITDLDLSTSAFDELADESLGRLSGATWVWND